jgi:cytochrome c biogenesis protein CcmG/thiol:disulfide interchange protein DsbE
MSRNDAEAPTRRRLITALPLIVFVALASLLLLRLFGGDPGRVPSALIGQPAPMLELPPLEGLTRDGAQLPGLDPAAFPGNVTVVNVWASWCAPCRDEHPYLVRVAKDARVRLIGINYKDAPENARRFLGRFGNPFAAVGVDPAGRAAIEWGVYGVPETFIVGRDGRIAYKRIGPIVDERGYDSFVAQMEKALGG